MGVSRGRGGEVVGQARHHGPDRGGTAGGDEEADLVDADVSILPGRGTRTGGPFPPGRDRGIEVEPLFVTVGRTPENGQPQLAVEEIEAVLAARRDANARCLIAGVALDDEPASVDMLLPVGRTAG